MSEPVMFHYTNTDGYKAIASQVDWHFVASQPPGDNERGVYFTTLRPTEHRFSARTRIPKEKQECFFAFRGQEGLVPKEGGRGSYVLWTPDDYVVKQSRQIDKGSTEKLK